MRLYEPFSARSVSAIFLSLIFSLSLILSPSVIARQQAPQAPDLFSPELKSELKRLQQAALSSDYAYTQVARLSNNIGPRLSGSPQAQQAVEYVAGEMRRLGLEVRLEKLMVPHWVRGVETGEVVQFTGQAPNTTQKIALTALG